MLTVSSNHIVLGGGSGGGGGGSGDVVGAASSTDNAVARFDSTTGKVVQNSAVTIDDTGVLSCSGEVVSSQSDTTLVIWKNLIGRSLFQLISRGTVWEVANNLSQNNQNWLTISAFSEANTPRIYFIEIKHAEQTIGFLKPIKIGSSIIDNAGSPGTDGQVLKKVGGLVLWSNP